MPTDAETLKWVSVADFSPGIYAPRGTVLNATGPSQVTGQQSGAPLGAAQLIHAIVDSSSPGLDSSGNGHTGTLFNNPTSVSGLVVGDSDKALAFDPATNEYVAQEDTIGPSTFTAFSFGCLVKPTNTGDANVPQIWGIQGSGFEWIWIAQAPSGELAVRIGSQTDSVVANFTSLNPMTAGVTVRVVVTWDGTNIKLYINGSLDDTVAFAHPITLSAGNKFFAATDPSNTTGNVSFDGVIDECFFLDSHALSAGEVTTIDDAMTGVGGNIEAIILSFTPYIYWRFNSSRVTTPGTFRCVSAPGKGLIGAPRRVPTAQVSQSFPIVAGTSNDDIINTNTMVDSSGNAHHGEYNLAQLTRVTGAFGDDGAIQQVSTTSPITPSVTPVAVLQFNSDWTVNVWAKIADTGASVGHTLLDVTSPSTGSRIKLVYFNKSGANQFFMSLARTPNGAATVTYVPPATTFLPAGYHMLTFKFNLAGCFTTLYVDGVLIGSSAVVAAPVPAIFGTDAVITTAFEGLTGDTWDELSLHAALLTNADVTAIYAAGTDHLTYKTEILTFTPTSYYAFSEDGTHATGEARALITASHLISPVVDGSSSLQQTIPIAPAYQDGLFISYSQFVDQTNASATLMNNRVDCRFYKLWRDPIEYFSLTEAFPNGEESFIVLKRIDNTFWSAPFWHGVADFAEIVNSVTNNGVTPFTRQVAWLFNMVQSRISTNPYAFLIVGYPRASAHTTDSIEALASKALGAAFFTPELVFSHEGRLCAIDGYDGDGFGSGASGRGMNDIVYYTIRGADYAGPQVFSLQRPIEENQSGIRVAQSVNANELFLVKSIGGGAVISGDMDFPTIRRLPGLHSPGDIYAKPINTPLGVVYAGYGGVFLWSGAESSQLISEQFDGPFWNPYLGPFAQYTPAANRFGFQGGFGWLYPWLLSPSFFLWDSRFQSWWVLDDPSDLYPSLFMHGTGQGHILAVYPEINDDSDVIADRYDSELQATDYAWTSQPITPEMFRVATVREVNFQATVDAPDENATILITVAALDGTYEQNTITLTGDSRPHTYRATFAVDTETFIVSFNATGGTGGNLAAPIIHSFRVGYELTSQLPEMSA